MFPSRPIAGALAPAFSARTGAFTSTVSRLPSFAFDDQRHRHGLAFLQRLLQVHQHHVVAAGLQLHRLAGRQIQRRRRRASSSRCRPSPSRGSRPRRPPATRPTTSLPPWAEVICMKAPVAFCWATVPRTQGSVTVTCAAAGSAKVAAASARRRGGGRGTRLGHGFLGIHGCWGGARKAGAKARCRRRRRPLCTGGRRRDRGRREAWSGRRRAARRSGGVRPGRGDAGSSTGFAAVAQSGAGGDAARGDAGGATRSAPSTQPSECWPAWVGRTRVGDAPVPARIACRAGLRGLPWRRGQAATRRGNRGHRGEGTGPEQGAGPGGMKAGVQHGGDFTGATPRRGP